MLYGRTILGLLFLFFFSPFFFLFFGVGVGGKGFVPLFYASQLGYQSTETILKSHLLPAYNNDVLPTIIFHVNFPFTFSNALIP